MGCGNGKHNSGKSGESGELSVASAGAKDSKDAVRLLDKYSLGKVLGQGAFGVVYSCKKKGTGEEFAVKMVDQVETPLPEIRQEVEMLRKLRHPCTVKLIDVFYEKVFVCIVLDLCRGGDMIEGMQLHWKNKGMIPIPVIQNTSKMMFQGVEWLHQHNVVHRDLKGDNYLMDRKDIEFPAVRVFLADFGTVRELPVGDRLKQKCGTKTYWSPEFYQLNYGIKVDIWALGVVIFGMVTGRFPFKGEEDVKTKQVKIPSRTGNDGQTFLKGTLERSEQKRLSAREGLDHTFLSSIKSSAEVQEPFEKDFKPEVKEAGAHAGIKERRRELVERLENAQAKKDVNCKPTLKQSAKDASVDFTVEDKRLEKVTNYQWFSQAQCRKANFVDESKAQILSGDDMSTNFEGSAESIEHMLTSNNIPLDAFGKGQAKTFMEFAAELQGGQARLMLDASKHKSIVRVVDVVLLRLVHGSGASKKYLVVSAEKFPDGRSRPEVNQLAGAKKLPHENGVQAAKRVVRDRLNIDDAKIKFSSSKKESFEEDETSPSYPGVRTVYKKEIYEGVITTTDAAILQRIGLGTKNVEQECSHTDSLNYTRSFQWLSEAECTAKKVKLRAPVDGTDVSALVNPAVGYEEEELQKFLQDNNVDISKFGQDGTKSIAQFSEELVQGEAALVRQKNGKMLRVVDVLILKVQKSNGDTIVEVSETKNDGVTKERQRLPAVKFREDENPFIAARRVLNNVLRMSENLVELQTHNMMLVEEESDSKGYAGLPSLYRRRIVTAKLLG